MKPDAYMPYYGNDFEAACKGFQTATKWAYLCALWHYWHHTHCSGLPDDPESLRRICEVEETNWERVKCQIFKPPFFEMESGMWHQKRCRKTYENWNKAYESKCLGAAKSRTKIDTKPDINTDVSGKSESESESDPKPEPERKSIDLPPGRKKPRFFTKPSIEEMREHGTSIGLPIEESESCFHHYESNGWIVGKNPMKSWKSAMANWNKNWKTGIYRPQGILKLNAGSDNGHGELTTSQMIAYNKELDRCIDGIKLIRSQYESHQTWSPEHVKRFNCLVSRKKEIKKLLGVVE